MSGAAALAEELFEPLGPIAVRRMFGGAGLFRAGLMFGLIAEDAIFLKADAALAADLAAEGSQPFTYRRAGREVALGYWRLPDPALDNAEIALAWARRALAVAEIAASPLSRRASGPDLGPGPSARPSARPDARPRPRRG